MRGRCVLAVRACPHPAQWLEVEFVENRRYDWRVTCQCGFRWRPESPNIPPHVTSFVEGVAGQLVWRGIPLDYTEPPF